MFNFIRQHKWLSLLGVLNVVAVLFVVLVIVIHQSKTATIDIMVAPSEATIELNGQKYENLRSHNVTPGDYHVVISMEGMQTKELDLTAEDGELVRLWNYLVDENGSFAYYVNNPDDATLLNDVADADARAFLEEYGRVSSIVDVLPLTFSNSSDENATEIISISVRWGTGDECNNKPYCLIVHDYTGENTDKALAMIREAGFNPDDYELVFEKGDE